MIVRIYKIPGFISQLYLNYDCDMYTHDVFEDLSKMLSKNAFPLSELYSTHLLSLDALLTIIFAIEKRCKKEVSAEEFGSDISEKETQPTTSSEQCGNDATAPQETEPENLDETEYSVTSHEQLMALKHKKKIITTATEQFNGKPSKGIAYMQEMGLIPSPTDPVEVGNFMRENPHLDKKQIGEYVSNRKNLQVLEAYVNGFEFTGMRVDESLRQFLESFRLPGEAPLITLILEKFAEHWQVRNYTILGQVYVYLHSDGSISI